MRFDVVGEPAYSLLVGAFAALVAVGLIRVTAEVGAAGLVGLAASWAAAASWGVLDVVRDNEDSVSAGNVAPIVVCAIAVALALAVVVARGPWRGYLLLGASAALLGWGAARVASAVSEPTLTRVPEWADHGATAVGLGVGAVVLLWCVRSDVLLPGAGD